MKNFLIAASIVLALVIPQPAAAFSLKTPFVKAGHALKKGAVITVAALVMGIYIYGQSQ